MKEEDVTNYISSLTLKKGIFHFFLLIVAIAVFGFILNWVGVIGKIANAPAKIISKTLETDNIIHNYEWFYDVNASYEARFEQVKQFKTFFNEETDKSERSRLRIEMSAMQQTCRELAKKYNANSEKMNRSIFKGWSLPEALSSSACE